MYSIMLNNMFLNKSERVFVCVCEGKWWREY